MKAERFTTLDLYLAAFLEMNGCRPDLVVQGGKVVFAFPHSRKAHDLVEKFNTNISIPVADFATAVKILRNRMFQAKGDPR
jgi:hypothetical protein